MPSIWQEASVGQMRDDGMPDETRGTRFLPCGDRYGLGKIDKNVYVTKVCVPAKKMIKSETLQTVSTNCYKHPLFPLFYRMQVQEEV